MLVAWCVDNNNGLMFNGRRVSRDKAVYDDYISTSQNKIYAQSCSEDILGAYASVIFSDNPFDDAGADDSVFIESLAVMPYISKIDKIYVYKWNRDYPSDLKVDIDPTALGFKITETVEFPGNSHDIISKEIYVR